MTVPAEVPGGADATSGNLATIPAGLQMALYVTGGDGIPATAAGCRHGQVAAGGSG